LCFSALLCELGKVGANNHSPVLILSILHILSKYFLLSFSVTQCLCGYIILFLPTDFAEEPQEFIEARCGLPISVNQVRGAWSLRFVIEN
jgi:hypothetical protein